MKQHLGRQAGVEKVEVSLIDGKVDVTPKGDGQIDPIRLLKATYDSGVSVAEMDVIASGKIVKDSSGALALQVEPDRAFPFVTNPESQELESLAGTATVVTLRGELYKKAPGKKKFDASAPLKLSITEVQKKD